MITNGTLAAYAKRLIERLAPAPRHIAWRDAIDPATGKPLGWATVPEALTADRLKRHLSGEAVLGAYPAADGVARFGVIDVDCHPPEGRESTPEEIAAAEAFAFRKSKELDELGVDHVLLRGHEAGSYHIDFATAPIGAARLGRWLEKFVSDAGTVHVDTFPSATGEGNAVRLPGRHHKRPDAWTALWNGTWEPWPAPLVAMLELNDNPPGLFLDPGEPSRKSEPTEGLPRSDRPGDIFNLTVPVTDVLAAYGWTAERESKDRTYYTRPGKAGGVSASVRDGTVWVHSSSVPGLPKNEKGSKEHSKPYSAFALIAYLEFDGDFKQAAGALAKQGFCPEPPASAPEPTLHADVKTPESPEWPTPPDAAAYHGLAGDIVKVIEPASEADPVAILVQTLVCFGNRIGRNAYWQVEATRHYGNEFAVIMGQTAKGRKGTSWDQAIRLFRTADDAPDDPLNLRRSWGRECIASGLSSGEGVIHQVRDPVEKDGETTDQGVEDKRLLVVETEFANVLKQCDRQGNILSTVIRQSWDTGTLRTLTKHSPTRATGAHVSIIGHVTTEELTRYLSATESANGFANRFGWFLARRSKLLPEGGQPDPQAMEEVSDRLREAIRFAEGVELINRDAEAREIWYDVYGPLSDGRPGLAGALLGRAEAHVMRYAMLYAMMDSSPAMRAEHLLAALALWDYAERSILFVFGDALGDPMADDLLKFIRQAGSRGVTRSDISAYLSRNAPSDKVNRALVLLRTHGLAHDRQEKTGGRAAERWYPGPPPTAG